MRCPTFFFFCFPVLSAYINDVDDLRSPFKTHAVSRLPASDGGFSFVLFDELI